MNRGISIYLAVFILIALMSIVLSLSTMSFTQIKIMRDIGYSVIAFHAADSGTEYVLNLSRNASTSESPYFGSLDNNATWTASVFNPGSGNCAVADNFCIDSQGGFQSTQRAIQITR